MSGKSKDILMKYGFKMGISLLRATKPYAKKLARKSNTKVDDVIVEAFYAILEKF